MKKGLFMILVYFYIEYQLIHKPHTLHFAGSLPITKVIRAFSLLF